MRSIFIFAIGAVAFFATPAFAEMPNYDVKAHCQQVAGMGGGSQMILQGCFQQEQSSYNSLKPTWDSLSPTMRNHCNQVASMGGGSYMILKGCVDMELNSANANKSFEFKR